MISTRILRGRLRRPAFTRRQNQRFSIARRKQMLLKRQQRPRNIRQRSRNVVRTNRQQWVKPRRIDNMRMNRLITHRQQVRSTPKMETTKPINVTQNHQIELETMRRNFNIEQYTCSIEKELKQSPKPKIDTTGITLQWPPQLIPIFAISLRKDRFNNLLVRMKQWARLITLLPATDGHKISPDKWAGLGRLKERLCSGQVGCYESHVRIWQKVVDLNLDSALVLEDDADITYTQNTVDKLNEFLSELKTIPNWDLAYIGNVGLHPVKQQLAKHITEPSNWEGLFTYYISNKGARKLIQNAFPIRMAIDIYVGQEARQGHIRTVSMTPPLNYVVPVDSDTCKNL